MVKVNMSKRNEEGCHHYYDKLNVDVEYINDHEMPPEDDIEDDDDDDDEEAEGVITIEGIELEATIDRVKECLKTNNIEIDDLDEYDFYLQENQLHNGRSIIEQCNLVEGAKQQTRLINIKLIFDPELKRINILDILKPPENNNPKSPLPSPPVQSQSSAKQSTNNQPKRLIGGIKNTQNTDGHTISSPGNRTGNNGQIQLWQFLLELLTDADHREYIQWIGTDGN